MSYTTKTWYKVSACDKTTLESRFVGYVVTGDEIDITGKMVVTAIYDFDDLITNKLTYRGGYIGVDGNPHDLWYDESNRLDYDNHATSDINYWSVSHKTEGARSEVVFSIQSLNENSDISELQQKLLANTSYFPNPYLFLSPGCAIDVQNRNIDFTQSNSIVFDGSKVNVKMNTADTKTLNELFIDLQQLESVLPVLTRLTAEVEELRLFINQMTATLP
jgi:hypothetical protein